MLDRTVTDLSDAQLLAEVHRLTAVERRATVALIRALAELDERRLFLAEGCSSLFGYCTQVLHLAEGSAYNRIEAARTARRFPLVLLGLQDGSLTVTAIRLLAPHLTPDNHEAVIAAARHKTKRQIEILIAALQPRPAVPLFIRSLSARSGDVATTPSDEAPTAPPDRTPVEMAGESDPSLRAVVEPLSPEQFRVQFTISRDTHDKLRRAQDLLRHTIPSGDPAAIFDRALTLLLEAAERRRHAATSSPRPARQAAPASRHVPAAVRRKVWKRDGGQCAFVGSVGRCQERGFLEFHHVKPYAAGGTASVENIELRCRAHNAHEASLFFSPPGQRASAANARAPTVATASTEEGVTTSEDGRNVTQDVLGTA